MLRQIVTPQESAITLQLPADMVGKTVEILAFEITEAKDVTADSDTEAKKERIKNITDPTLTDLSKFKFNRNDANDYSC